MKLYLVQHAHAVDKAEDPQRPLSPRGQSDARAVAQFLRPLAIELDAIWHSPKARSVQTAQILAEALRLRQGLVQRPDLTPGAPIRDIVHEFRDGQADRMIVGHLPHLAKLASKLLTGSKWGEVIAFCKGGVVCLQSADGECWQVAWMLNPELLFAPQTPLQA